MNPDLVARDEEGKIVTVRYQAVNAMLLNEFLKEHRKVEELEKQVEKLTTGIGEGERGSRDEPPDAESGSFNKALTCITAARRTGTPSAKAATRQAPKILFRTPSPFLAAPNDCQFVPRL